MIQPSTRFRLLSVLKEIPLRSVDLKVADSHAKFTGYACGRKANPEKKNVALKIAEHAWAGPQAIEISGHCYDNMGISNNLRTEHN